MIQLIVLWKAKLWWLTCDKYIFVILFSIMYFLWNDNCYCYILCVTCINMWLHVGNCLNNNFIIALCRVLKKYIMFGAQWECSHSFEHHDCRCLFLVIIKQCNFKTCVSVLYFNHTIISIIIDYSNTYFFSNNRPS